MQELQIFKNSEFGEVRTTEENGKIIFCGSDVAKALGYVIPHKAVREHCKGVLKQTVLTNGGKQEMLFISEGDIYRLVIKSQLPTAEKFESWVFDEVLPSVRKHGVYMTSEAIEKVLLNPDTIIKIATQLKAEQETNKILQQQIEADKPKVIFANAVTASKTSILVGELAKIIKQNGIDVGQNRFFTWLRDNGYLIKRKGTDFNMPTQKSMEQCLFEIKETSIVHADGHTSISKTPKVTGKGQTYFVNLFLNNCTA